MNSPVRKIGLVLKRHDPRVRDVVTEIIPWLQARGVEVFLDQETASQYPLSSSVRAADELASNVDVVAVFGGDGTFLYAARLAGRSGVPLLGINLGSLGFLAEVKLEDMHPAFERLLAGQYQLEERVLVDVSILRQENQLAHYLALNDAVINKGALARMIELEVWVNSELVTITRADGLIISTPTGSTAYSMSAGGPIVYPTLGAFIITPICPHTLSNRPVVVPDGVAVGVCLRHGGDVMLTVDGQVGMPLTQGDCIRFQKARSTIRLIQATNSTFFMLLREKLKWN
ncbi:MAG: NAD(+)/NADH kinase [Acidobacteriia bacterium]|nr:NAD(+)/NADH kinase [Terriglobia bacterium]